MVAWVLFSLNAALRLRRVSCGLLGDAFLLLAFILIQANDVLAQCANPTTANCTLTADPAAAFGIGNAVGVGHVVTVNDLINITGAVTTDTVNQGTLTFSGNSTVTGAIGLTGARLRAINGGAAGATVTLTGGDVFVVDLDFTSTGTISLGSATTVTNGIDFAGSDGTLSLGAGVSITGAINNTGAAGGNVTFAGSSNLAGSLGAANVLGTLTLNGATTTVAVTGSIRADTLNLNGNSLTATTTATLAGGAEIINATITSATTNGKLTATGIAIIPATTTLNITVTASDFIASGTQFTIVDGAGGGGQVADIATITDNSTQLSFTQVITNNDDLIITASRSVTYTTTVPVGSTASAAATTLTALNDAGSTGDLATVLAGLDGLIGTAQAAAILSTTPEVSGGAAAASFSAQGETLGTVSARLGDVRAGLDSSLDQGVATGFATGNRFKGVGIWLRGFGSHSDQDKREGVDGYKADTFGAAVGADRRLLEDRLTLGLAYAYAASDVNSTGERGGNGTDVTSHQATAYGSYDLGRWYAEGMINLAYNDYDSARLVSIGTINRTAKGDYQGWQYGAKIAGGYNIGSGPLVFTPMMSLQYSHLDLDGYTETGADSLNLIVNSENFDQVRSSLGARMAHNLKSGVGGIKLELHAAWLYDLVTDKQEFTSAYSGGGAAFKTEGAEPARHGANIGASITLHSTGNVSLSANYDAEIKDRYISHNGMFTARYSY